MEAHFHEQQRQPHGLKMAISGPNVTPESISVIGVCHVLDLTDATRVRLKGMTKSVLARGNCP